jgi:hypothetical protein
LPKRGLSNPDLEKPGLEKPGLEKPGLPKPGFPKRLSPAGRPSGRLPKSRAGRSLRSPAGRGAGGVPALRLDFLILGLLNRLSGAGEKPVLRGPAALVFFELRFCFFIGMQYHYWMNYPFCNCLFGN